MSSLERQPSAPPLYSQVETRLLERIRRDFRPGQLLPTQQALALCGSAVHQDLVGAQTL